jgi:hypothetical protein
LNVLPPKSSHCQCNRMKKWDPKEVTRPWRLLPYWWY